MEAAQPSPPEAPTRELILDAAARLFAARGYAGTSLRAIASGVGIQNPSLYKHFESKEAIYDAVLERAIRPVLYEFWDTEDEISRVMGHLAALPEVSQLMLRETTSGSVPGSPIVMRWLLELVERSRDWLPDRPDRDATTIALRVLALYHVAAGFVASAATRQAITGLDPDEPALLEEQTRILGLVSDALFQ